MILDIDNFKSVNDTHGHGVGDLALVAFANHLKTNIRKGDVAIRWGGEEFIVLFKGMDDDKMMHHSAARLLERPLRIPELPAPITFSAGVTRIRDYLTVAEAVQLADDLLYHVKQHGKRNIAYTRGKPSALSAIRVTIRPPERPGFCRSPAICYHPGHADCFRPGHGAG